MWYLFLILVFLLHVNSHNGNKLLLILLDGCRWDYPEEDHALKGFKRIADNGVRSVSVTPVFPTNSYPNYLSLVTGLYPENHGFVNNIMYDAKYNDFFLMAPHKSASEPHWWNEAEPLWITAEKSGRKSALFWWDGCLVEIHGKKPSLCKPYIGYTDDVEFEKVLLASLELLENDEMQLVQIYHESLDKIGHYYGSNSTETKHAFKTIDNILNNLQTKQEDKGLHDKVDLVVVSDHGILTTDPDELNLINLKSVVDVSLIKYMIYFGPFSMIMPEEGKLDILYYNLTKVTGLNVYKKEEIPERYHLKNHYHTMTLLLVANRSFFIEGLDIEEKSIPTGNYVLSGTHGYDVEQVPEMKGIFFARGPSFKKGYVIPPLEIVDLYNVFCHCLKIAPLPNNGSRTKISPIWSKEKCQEKEVQSSVSYNTSAALQRKSKVSVEKSNKEAAQRKIEISALKINKEAAQRKIEITAEKINKEAVQCSVSYRIYPCFVLTKPTVLFYTFFLTLQCM